MNSEAAADTDITSVISGFEQLGDRFVAGLYARLAALKGVPVEFDNLKASLAAGGTSLLRAPVPDHSGCRARRWCFRTANRRLNKAIVANSAWRRFFAGVAATVLALVIGFIAARLLAGSGVPLQTLRLWAVVTVSALSSSPP